MKIVNKKYPYIFFQGDFPKMKPASEDVSFEKNGRLFSQFFKGQLIPIEIWEEVFTETQETEEEVDETESEDKEEILIENDIKEVKEVKVPRKRRKSIIKK